MSRVEHEEREGFIRKDGTIEVPGALYLFLADFALRYPVGTPVRVRLEAKVDDGHDPATSLVGEH